MKQIEHTLVLRRKKLFQAVKNSGELLLIKEIGRTVGNRETWTIESGDLDHMCCPSWNSQFFPNSWMEEIKNWDFGTLAQNVLPSFSQFTKQLGNRNF